MDEFPDNVVEMINARLSGFDGVMGLRFVSATPLELVAELEIGDQHLQPYGLVHGGVYAGMIETLCSTGAALGVFAEGKSAVGLENSTAFVRAVRTGVLHGTATPLHRGGRSQVWQARIEDDRGELVAHGRVRMLVLEAGSTAAGETVKLDDGD